MNDTKHEPGHMVRLTQQPPYFKTADPMPMMRPASVVAVGEEGRLMDRRPGNCWAVKFNNGIFLVDQTLLMRV